MPISMLNDVFCSLQPCLGPAKARMKDVKSWAGAQPAFKNRSFRNLFFFDIVATLNNHPSYVKHVLGSIYVFFT